MSGLTFRDLFLVPTRRRTYEPISSPPFPLAPLNCHGDPLLSPFTFSRMAKTAGTVYKNNYTPKSK